MDSKYFGDTKSVTICDVTSLRERKYLNHGYRRKFRSKFEFLSELLTSDTSVIRFHQVYEPQGASGTSFYQNIWQQCAAGNRLHQLYLQHSPEGISFCQNY